MDIKGKFSKLLRSIRKQKCLTIKELAAKSGLTERYLYFLENGTYQPSLEKLYKLAEALKIDPKEIIERLNNSE